MSDEELRDLDAIRRDHGVGIGVPSDPIRNYSGPIEHISDEEAIRRDHGVGIGVPMDPMESYGTRDPDLTKLTNNLMYCNNAANLGEQMSVLADESIIKIVERRFRNTAYKLQQKGYKTKEQIEELGQLIWMDLRIISQAISQDRNLYEANINATCLMGEENYQNIIGLLDAYQTEIQNAGYQIPISDGKQTLDASTLIQYVKAQAEQNKKNWTI